jgi:hypothetical protein
MTALDATATDMEPLRRRALLAGGVALAICLIGALFNRAEFFRSYLIAYVFWLGVPLGCLGIVMIHHLVGGTWGFVIQRPLESALRTLPLMALLFVPVCFGLSDLYVWTQADVVRHDPLLQQKSAYLNVPFFIARAVIYFVIWITVGQRLTQWSAEQDRSADAGANRTFVERLQTPMVLVYLWHDLHGRRRVAGVGVCHRGRLFSVPARAARRGERALGVSGSRQFAARLRHAVGVHQLFAVSDHLD